MEDSRIHIFGASGSGVTTLAIALAKDLDIPTFDFEDYYWKNTAIPFTEKHEPNERLRKLKKDIGDNKCYIISGHYGEYAYSLDDELTLAIFIYTPQDIRIERLRKRELEKFGSRVLEGGDMHENSELFIKWAMGYDKSEVEGRTLEKHIKRILTLKCPVLKLDGTKPVDMMIKELRTLI